MIKAFTLRLLHQPQPADVRALLLREKQYGANAVALVPHHYCLLGQGNVITTPPTDYRITSRIWPDVGQMPTHQYQNTPSDDLVYWCAKEAEAQGLTVLLKPHLDWIEGGWRAWIEPGNRYRFTAAYRAFLTRYLRIARQLLDPIFVMGCELLRTTVVLGADFWVEMARWIRSPYGGNYRGRLTYAANHGRNVDAEHYLLRPLWPYLDYVGIDDYQPREVPTAYGPTPTYDDLLRAWDEPLHPEWGLPSIAASMLATAEAANRPLLLTEFGCSNYTDAMIEPGADPPADAVRDDRLQADYYRAMRARWDTEPRFAGFVAWEAALGAQPEVSHSIVGREAEAVAFV